MLRSDRRLLALAICLSTLAGFVDSIGFLHAGGFFVSFMSGNSTRFAVGLSEGASAALTALGLIAGFVTGVTLGAVIGHKAGERRRTAVLLTVTLLLLSAALLAPFNGTLPMIAMVLAMGIENAALTDHGEVKVGLTYMTGALVRIGHGFGNVLMGIERLRWTVDMGLWCGLVSGAIGGAFAYRWLGMGALWLASGFAAALTLAAQRADRSASGA
jgi:uncharacterized membrane protein YoaK (UPF0700 family)